MTVATDRGPESYDRDPMIGSEAHLYKICIADSIRMSIRMIPPDLDTKGNRVLPCQEAPKFLNKIGNKMLTYHTVCFQRSN